MQIPARPVIIERVVEAFTAHKEPTDCSELIC